MPRPAQSRVFFVVHPVLGRGTFCSKLRHCTPLICPLWQSVKGACARYEPAQSPQISRAPNLVLHTILEISHEFKDYAFTTGYLTTACKPLHFHLVRSQLHISLSLLIATHHALPLSITCVASSIHVKLTTTSIFFVVVHLLTNIFFII